ncbi:PPC domain-containing protein, partial [Microcoleus sp. ARI1-A5]
MSETNIGALTGSKTYTGTVDSKNIFDLYQFNIKNTGSFQLSVNGLTSNADLFVLNSSGTTLYTSANMGTSAETISVDNLIAGDYAVKVLQISGNTNYSLSLTAALQTEKAIGTDSLTGAKSDAPLPAKDSTISAVTSTSEKSTATKDPITGNLAEEKTAAPTNNSQVAGGDKTAIPTDITTTKTEPEKTVAGTESAISASEKRTEPGTLTTEKSEETAKTTNSANTAATTTTSS